MAALWVKAMGLASPLGGAVQAAAAFRAGLAHPSPAPDVDVMFPGDDEPQPVSVHALPTATFGFSGVGRLVALLAEALADLAASVDLALLGPETGLFLALPDPEDRGFRLSRHPEQNDPETAEARIPELGGRILALAGQAAGVDLRRFEPRFFAGDHGAFAATLEAAHRAITAREVGAVLVGAVDSLASQEAVDEFAAQDRVKNGDRPAGFAPGEAGALFLLEPPPRADVKQPVVLVSEPALGADARSFDSGSTSDGRVLAECVQRAVQPAAADAPAPVLLSDHDGETHRAYELGSMQQRLMALGNRRLADATVWFPATSFGNTGAASGAVSLALASRAIVRGYAPAAGCAVLSSADGGGRAAWLVYGSRAYRQDA